MHQIDFRTKKIARDKKGHYVIIKGSIHQEHRTILNVYTPKKQSSKIHEAKTHRAERKNRQIYNNSQELQESSLRYLLKILLNRKSAETENSKQHNQLKESNQRIQELHQKAVKYIF